MSASTAPDPATGAAPTAATPPRSYRFRPRFSLLAYTALAFGLLLCVAGLALGLDGGNRALALGIGAAGLVLGGLYLLSPTWKLAVTLDDEALEVRKGDRPRFRLPWSEVVRVVAAPSTRTCFVDGGAPERSLLVPGPGASAPYLIDEHAALYDGILARVPDHVVTTVESVDAAARAQAHLEAGAEHRGERP